MKGNISKRFPANVTLDTQTFLNDKKIDGELYALFRNYRMQIKMDRQWFQKMMFLRRIVYVRNLV